MASVTKTIPFRFEQVHTPCRTLVTLSYRADDPYAVCMTFADGKSWYFARQLLADGLGFWRVVGDGDVRIGPAPSAPFLLGFRLANERQSVLLSTDRGAVADFLAETYRLVPSIAENQHVDFDTELAALLLVDE